MDINFKAGQVINFKNRGFFSKTIAMGLGNYWTHTGWIHTVKGDKILIQEALGSKTKKVTINEYSRQTLVEKFEKGELKIMDFGIKPNEKFYTYAVIIDGLPYDYYAILELAVARLLTLFGINPSKFLEFSVFNRVRMKLNPYFTTKKKVDCSEAISRGIAKLTMIDVIAELKVDKFEQVTPQLVSVLYDRLKTLGKL